MLLKQFALKGRFLLAFWSELLYNIIRSKDNEKKMQKLWINKEND